MLRSTIIAAAVCFAASTAFAQVTIQQPVLEQFGVNTTVVVPDRGSALLGSVSRAGDFYSRQGFGPLTSSRVRDSFRNHSSVNASVQIIDIHEMDRMILEGADPYDETYSKRSATPSRRQFSNPAEARAHQAFASMLDAHRRRSQVQTQSRSASTRSYGSTYRPTTRTYGSSGWEPTAPYTVIRKYPVTRRYSR